AKQKLDYRHYCNNHQHIVHQAKTVSKITPGFTWFPSKVESTSTAAATTTSTSSL
ncbi:hypothetical protein LINGRAHAP2_LOCUS27738, partial [Linum grandiflorum]